MRTTVRLDEALLREAKQVAANSGRSLTAVIEEALRESLGRRKDGTSRRRVKLPTSGSGGLRPGVDLDDSASLWALLDRPDAPV
ncbi:MAG TPA: type II toxin-antitoxin system VapB family antitoxin [Thermoanaerobaculia bacterium]|nr:type II toxin-antitoxin system VapB family antitoxin [Thermoanaerobaculia bacterium]